METHSNAIKAFGYGGPCDGACVYGEGEEVCGEGAGVGCVEGDYWGGRGRGGVGVGGEGVGGVGGKGEKGGGDTV